MVVDRISLKADNISVVDDSAAVADWEDIPDGVYVDGIWLIVFVMMGQFYNQ
jgi:hypothetical protein